MLLFVIVSSLTARLSLPGVGGLEVTYKTVSQSVGIIQPEAKDHISVRENCKTPENVQEYKVQGWLVGWLIRV